MSSARLEKLYAILEQTGLDAVALVPGANLYYLTGSAHHLMERLFVLIIPLEGEPVAVLPNIEQELFASHGFEARLFPWHDADGFDDALSAASASFGGRLRTIGVEGKLMRFFEGEALRRHFPTAEVHGAEKALARLRLHKEPSEIDYLRRAIQISEAALAETLREVRIGMTERAIANLLVAQLNAQGAEAIAFAPLVLAGENSARPHGMVRADYAIQPGDPLLFDFGAVFRGYNADITRTVFVGEPTPEHRAIYAAVKTANEAARAAARPGMTADALDTVTLDALKGAGFGALILHKTGHGLGLEIHEDPYIVQGSPEMLEPGMVFTIEPGLYQSGSIGVRIEDDVVLTDAGCETLTTFSRELTIVGV